MYADSINYGTVVVALKIYEPRYLHRFQRVSKYFFFATHFSSKYRSSGIANIKKKMRGISREENFTSEKYNSVYTSCIDDRVYTRSLWSKSWRIDSIRLLCRTIAHFHARKSYCASAFTSPCPLFVKMITQKVVLTVQRLRRTFYLAS